MFVIGTFLSKFRLRDYFKKSSYKIFILKKFSDTETSRSGRDFVSAKRAEAFKVRNCNNIGCE